MIRKAVFEDLVAIDEIYNEAMATRSTADISPLVFEKRIEWFNDHNPEIYPVFVYESENRIVGWVSLGAYRKARMALRHTAEMSYYVHSDFQRKGIGTKMIKFAVENASRYGIRNLIAIILEHNIGSIALIEKLEFSKCGFLPEVADFDGFLSGHLYYMIKI